MLVNTSGFCWLVWNAKLSSCSLAMKFKWGPCLASNHSRERNNVQLEDVSKDLSNYNDFCLEQKQLNNYYRYCFVLFWKLPFQCLKVADCFIYQDKLTLNRIKGTTRTYTLCFGGDHGPYTIFLRKHFL